MRWRPHAVACMCQRTPVHVCASARACVVEQQPVGLEASHRANGCVRGACACVRAHARAHTESACCKFLLDAALIRLDLCGCALTSVRASPTLQRLLIEGCLKLGDETVSCIGETCGGLTELGVSGLPMLSPDPVARLRLPRLRSLRLADCAKLTAAGRRRLRAKLRCAPAALHFARVAAKTQFHRCDRFGLCVAVPAQKAPCGWLCGDR